MNRWIIKAIGVLFRGYIFGDLKEEEKKQIIRVAEALEASYRDGYEDAKRGKE